VGYEQDISTQLLAVRCCFCSKPLRDPTSIERGYGPDCDENYMGGFGEAAVWARMQSAFSPTEAAEAIRSAPTIEPTSWVQPSTVAERGELLEDGTKAKGGEILSGSPLRPGSLRAYWERIGGSSDSSRARWLTDPSVRHEMVSKGIWYASRAVTFGFAEHIVSAEKADPRFLVVASVQRFARAVGLDGAASRMANFYAARVLRVVKKQLKEREKLQRDAILFETVHPEHPMDVWNPVTRRAERQIAGTLYMRVNAPYSEEFNRLARENRSLFATWEKDPPYFWRYFRTEDLRHVVNILQECFADRPALHRRMETAAERSRKARLVQVVDSFTGEVRLFERAQAQRLVANARYEVVS
jgi:hypothetical protein